MLTIPLILIFLSVFSFILGIIPMDWENRPKLQFVLDDLASGSKKKVNPLFSLVRKVAVINKPMTAGLLGKRISKDLAMAQLNLSSEEFFFLKELCILFALGITFPFIQPDMIIFWLCMGIAIGYLLPEFWMKGKIKKVKTALVRQLPDAIDLLTLCVNAGLDFMLALKWIVEKSPPSVAISEFNTVMQEINLGKTRRDAIKDLATKYDLADLSTLARTLIQADKMGTSVAEALNILSEDMRLSRFRRGEQLAMKAPLKMLVPLLLFIFPVVAVLVAGPIFLDFITNNPMKSLGSG